MQHAFWRISRLLFYLLCGLAAIGVAARHLVPSYLTADGGCYWNSALITYIDCPDVPAGGAIAFLLNLPSWVFANLHELAFYVLQSGVLFEGHGRPLFWVLVSLVCLLLLFIGGLFPLRWLYEKRKPRTPPDSVGDRKTW